VEEEETQCSLDASPAIPEVPCDAGMAGIPGAPGDAV